MSLDVLKLSYAFRSQNHQVLTFKLTSCQYPLQVHTQRQAYKVDTNDKSAETNPKERTPKGTFHTYTYNQRNIFTLSPIIKCYNCQGYGHFTVNYPTPFMIANIDRVFIDTPNPDSTISPKITHMIKEFNVVSPAVTTIVSFVTTTTVFYLPFSTLLSTSPFLLLLLLTLIIIVCSGRQPFPPLLLTPSHVIMKLVYVLSEDHLGKLPLTLNMKSVNFHFLEIFLCVLCNHLEGVNR